MSASRLRLHAFVPQSRANGPGTRAVIWVQGCTLGCPGCFNPQTHPLDAGESIAVDDLAARVAALGARIDGITVSGGEPLRQFDAVIALLERLRSDSDLGVILFTGHTWAEVQAMPASATLLSLVDAVIAGRYVQARRTAGGLRGSDNQTVHLLSDRYRAADLESVPTAEALIGPDGTVTFSGIDPPRW